MPNRISQGRAVLAGWLVPCTRPKTGVKTGVSTPPPQSRRAHNQLNCRGNQWHAGRDSNPLVTRSSLAPPRQV
jgi:hypothetical protein